MQEQVFGIEIKTELFTKKQNMNDLIDNDFKVPEQVVLAFIKSSYKFCKICPVGPKGYSDKCIKNSLELIHYYTYLKFHPYDDYRSGLNTIKDVKEIDSIELINQKETKVITKKNKNTIPVCEFTLKFKNRKWKIVNVHIKQGENNYYSIFVN